MSDMGDSRPILWKQVKYVVLTPMGNEPNKRQIEICFGADQMTWTFCSKFVNFGKRDILQFFC